MALVKFKSVLAERRSGSCPTKILPVPGNNPSQLERALEQDVQILMIQEHRLVEGPLASAQVRAISKGWQGVWQPAMNTGKHGRSGGVATLVRQPILMIKGGGDYNHRWHRVMVQWKNTEAKTKTSGIISGI